MPTVILNATRAPKTLMLFIDTLSILKKKIVLCWLFQD